MRTLEKFIRFGKLDDIPPMLLLLEALFSIEADFEFDPARVRRGLAELLKEGANAAVWVAEIDGKIVGMCTLQVLISTAEGGEVGLIEDVIVLKEYRGRGVGKQLLNAAQTWALEHGLKRLQLLADRENTEALDFYRRLGWRNTQLICRQCKLK